MSHYLVERIAALSNVDVRTQTELVQLIGDAHDGLQAVNWQERSTGREEQRPIRHVFLFLGAVPNTDWLKRCALSVDDKGFVRTGTPPLRLDVRDDAPCPSKPVGRASSPSATSVPAR